MSADAPRAAPSKKSDLNWAVEIFLSESRRKNTFLLTFNKEGKNASNLRTAIIQLLKRDRNISLIETVDDEDKIGIKIQTSLERVENITAESQLNAIRTWLERTLDVLRDQDLSTGNSISSLVMNLTTGEGVLAGVFTDEDGKKEELKQMYNLAKEGYEKITEGVYKSKKGQILIPLCEGFLFLEADRVQSLQEEVREWTGEKIPLWRIILCFKFKKDQQALVKFIKENNFNFVVFPKGFPVEIAQFIYHKLKKGSLAL